MDFESLKDQWNEVEDRDGVRLSWNVFPSTRMVSEREKETMAIFLSCTHDLTGSLKACCTDRSSLHSLEGET
jgi:hypothetical protein